MGSLEEGVCDSLIDAAQDFLQFLPPSEGPLWIQVIKMTKLARRAAKAPFNEGDLQRVLLDMGIGGDRSSCALFRLWLNHSSLDVFCIHVRAQNPALIVHRINTHKRGACSEVAHYR